MQQIRRKRKTVMTSEEWIAAGAVSAVVTIRQLTMKMVADRISGRITAAFSSVWMAAAALATYPFFSDHLTSVAQASYFNDPIALTLSILKGVVLFISFHVIQGLRKESQSSAIFVMPIAMAAAAVVNVFLFGERLSMIQLLGVVGIGITGVMFYLRGHAHQLSPHGKRYFGLSILLVIIMILLDHNAISRSNWYFYIFVYSIAMCVMNLFDRLSLHEWKRAFTHPTALLAGIVWTVGEFYFISVSVAILPVTITLLAAQMALPLLLILSAVIWKEKTWQEQLLFGCIIFVAGFAILYNR